MLGKRAIEILVVVFLAWYFVFSLKFLAGVAVGLAFGFWEGLPIGRNPK